MPQIACPHPLYGVASHELRRDGINPVSKATQEDTRLGTPIALFRGVRSQKLYAHARQLLPGLGRVVVAIPDEQTGGALGEFGENREFVGVGRSHRQTGNDPWPADPRVHPESVKGLFEEGVFAEGGFSLKTPATVGSGEQTRW
jgi:hypothetical protein